MITEREADARATAEELRVGIAKITEQLTSVETELARLAVTREGMRSRLKRLAARGIHTEAEPGLFALAANTLPAHQP